MNKSKTKYLQVLGVLLKMIHGVILLKNTKPTLTFLTFEVSCEGFGVTNIIIKVEISSDECGNTVFREVNNCSLALSFVHFCHIF